MSLGQFVIVAHHLHGVGPVAKLVALALANDADDGEASVPFERLVRWADASEDEVERALVDLQLAGVIARVRGDRDTWRFLLDRCPPACTGRWHDEREDVA